MNHRAALVTGSARRIGKAIALHLAAEGWDIGIHYNTSGQDAAALARDIEARGVKAGLYEGDFSKPATAEKVARDFIGDFPGAALLVNSASIFRKDTVESLDPKFWDEHIQVNALAPILLTRAFHQRTSGPTCVVNMLDQKVAGVTPDFFSYTISKLALHNATRMLAMSLWPKTRVNGIAPGLVLPSGDQTEEQFRQAHNKTPLRVGPSLEEICRTVSLIANAPAMTGQVITIDGGRHLMIKFPFDDLPKD